MAIPRNLANFAPKLDSSGNPTFTAPTVFSAGTASDPSITFTGDTNTGLFAPAADTIAFSEGGAEAMRITSGGALLIGTTTTGPSRLYAINTANSQNVAKIQGGSDNSLSAGTIALHVLQNVDGGDVTANALFIEHTNTAGGTGGTLIRARGGLGGTAGDIWKVGSAGDQTINRPASDGTLIAFQHAGSTEGSISVSGSTVSYNAFSGGHWSQLLEGRGYNPDIPRGTVMSTIGEMCLWKSVEWTVTEEHPAIPAIEAKEAVLDEEGNVIEPSVEAVEGKEAWTESITHRKSYLGDLPVGATFEENGFTKIVVDDGNERLPKVKISDVVGDKAVYGVFQTWDDVQDMLVTSLGAFVVRIAAGVTVEIGDLLESNGDGCAKVQGDDIIRSKTIAKVTSTTPTDTYADGSYTVPAVIYCG
jgi:hypothetical protein